MRGLQCARRRNEDLPHPDINWAAPSPNKTKTYFSSTGVRSRCQKVENKQTVNMSCFTLISFQFFWFLSKTFILLDYFALIYSCLYDFFICVCWFFKSSVVPRWYFIVKLVEVVIQWCLASCSDFTGSADFRWSSLLWRGRKLIW